MDILAIIGVSALLRLLRRSRTSQPQPTNLVSPFPPTVSVRAPLWHLLLRAGGGLLLTGLLLGFALIPWPHAWPFSAMLLPSVYAGQRWIVHHIDLICIGTVVCALIEPGLVHVASSIARLARGCWLLPRLLILLIRLIGINLLVSFWRYRNWRLRCFYSQGAPDAPETNRLRPRNA